MTGFLRGLDVVPVDVPTGTVSLLFSDIEGSTTLLSRLGPAYAEVLSGQREVLRSAWAAHGGTEMGTEGDSFFVAFPTAPAAVAAAVQAQQGLASRDWPGGVAVNVRMGIHTGNPVVLDRGYVGMDVHRAARIAGSAHGGQVVISLTTAELVVGGLPTDVQLRDLGSFRLKDLPLPERLFQLTGANLLDGFPPLKTFGSASSLPRPATELVGRSGELAGLTALLSAGARLVTLTGPGGSGKTRLAIGVAAASVDRYPDGVFFVPLAAATTAEVMWTTIAEVLDVPPEARTPPALFTHVAQRRALFVLDNLEQIVGADTVVADLLREAPHTAVIAVTRRPLHLAAEHEHPVPPLELPDEGHADVTGAQACGAVQLFVQQARKVKPSFVLTADNVADVTALCRRLDGLPLAIELAAARSKLLSPRALLTRFDQALDIKEAAIDKPARQQTLRAAIDWSYDLLTEEQQAFFRRLGVFAGGADLDAITALTAELDALDMLTDLVDASLITISEDSDGEPRVALLETIRAYARDQLGAHGELDATSQDHAEHYLNLSQQLQPLMLTEQRKAIRARFQAEHDNIRAALEWALRAPTTSGAESNADDEYRVRIGLGLCAQAGGFWRSSGYSAEGLGWVERSIGRAGDQPWLERAECLREMGTFLHGAEQFERAHVYATASEQLFRQLNKPDRIPWVLLLQALIDWDRGNANAARALFAEAGATSDALGHTTDPRLRWECARIWGEFAAFEAGEGEYERSLELARRSLENSRGIGDLAGELVQQQNIACVLGMMGRYDDAEKQLRDVIPRLLDLGEFALLPPLAEDYGAVLAELGDIQLAVRLFGAAEALRERIASPRWPSQEAQIAGPLAKTRRELAPAEWTETWHAGRNTPIEAILTEAYATGGANLVRGYQRPGVEGADTEQVETGEAERPQLQDHGPGAHTS